MAPSHVWLGVGSLVPGLYQAKNLLLSWTALLCWPRCHFEVALWSHWLQRYSTPSWTALLCWARCPFEVASWLHCLQGNLTPSWTTCMCWLRLLLDFTLWSHSLHFNPLFFYVFLISSLWVFVSHKCCNCASKVHPLCFEKYSCFLSNFSQTFWEIPMKSWCWY